MGKYPLTFCNTPQNNCVSKSSSEYLLNKKASVISKMVGEAATPINLNQAGGPGDLTRAVQKRGRTFSFGTSSRTIKNRLNYNGKNKGGVDKKHNSYARFLARKVGGVLRQDKIMDDTFNYKTRQKCTTGPDCTNHKCRKERMPNSWADEKATGRSGNPGITVRAICGKKICKT